MHIAILGWGSLLWDKRPKFDDYHTQWEFDGPELKIEFSRVSQTRRGALTLVIDPSNGAVCRVAHAQSKRREPEDAICDLRCREGTTPANIGYYFADGSRDQSKDPDALRAIKEWAACKSIDVVVWTDLTSNFNQVCGRTFTVEHALSHICNLDAQTKSETAAYVRSAPDFVVTPLRTAIQSEPWFKP